MKLSRDWKEKPTPNFTFNLNVVVRLEKIETYEQLFKYT